MPGRGGALPIYDGPRSDAADAQVRAALPVLLASDRWARLASRCGPRRPGGSSATTSWWPALALGGLLILAMRGGTTLAGAVAYHRVHPPFSAFGSGPTSLRCCASASAWTRTACPPGS